jgi:hypothetical protein
MSTDWEVERGECQDVMEIEIEVEREEKYREKGKWAEVHRTSLATIGKGTARGDAILRLRSLPAGRLKGRIHNPVAWVRGSPCFSRNISRARARRGWVIPRWSSEYIP